MECPLKENNLRDINRALFMLNDLIVELEKAEKAGIDISEQRLRRDDLAAKLTTIKDVYFPGR